MRGVNKVILVGNVGQDPEIRFTQGGGQVVNASIATSETWKDKQTGQNQEKTEWHRVVFFNRLAEIAGEYLKKGNKVYIEGSLQTRKWTDQQGVERYSTDIRANEFQLLGNYTLQNRAQEDGPSFCPEAPATLAPAPRQAPAAPRPPAMPQPPALPEHTIYDDDIPF